MKPELGLESLTDDRVVSIVAELTAMPGRPRGDAWTRCEELRDEIPAQLLAGLKPTNIARLLAHRPTVEARLALEEVGHRYLTRRAAWSLERGAASFLCPPVAEI